MRKLVDKMYGEIELSYPNSHLTIAKNIGIFFKTYHPTKMGIFVCEMQMKNAHTYKQTCPDQSIYYSTYIMLPDLN